MTIAIAGASASARNADIAAVATGWFSAGQQPITRYPERRA